MDDREAQATGAVWCLRSDGLHRAGGEAVVTNGPAVSIDGQYLYHVDSGQRTIWRFALSAEPVLTGGEIFLRLEDAHGFPDGAWSIARTVFGPRYGTGGAYAATHPMDDCCCTSQCLARG